MGEILTEHYRFVQVLSTFSAAESLHDPEYRGLAHQAAELLIPVNTHTRRLFMAFRKYIFMRGVPLLQIIYNNLFKLFIFMACSTVHSHCSACILFCCRAWWYTPTGWNSSFVKGCDMFDGSSQITSLRILVLKRGGAPNPQLLPTSARLLPVIKFLGKIDVKPKYKFK